MRSSSSTRANGGEKYWSCGKIFCGGDYRNKQMRPATKSFSVFVVRRRPFCFYADLFITAVRLCNEPLTSSSGYYNTVLILLYSSGAQWPWSPRSIVTFVLCADSSWLIYLYTVAWRNNSKKRIDNAKKPISKTRHLWKESNRCCVDNNNAFCVRAFCVLKREIIRCKTLFV